MKAPKVASILILLAVSSVGCSSSSAACAEMGSSIQVQPEQVSKSGTLEVYGEGFGRLVECDDTGFAGEELEGAVYEPLRNTSIELRQGSRSWELASVDANQESTFREKLTLPAKVEPGQATVTADGNQGTVEAPISVAN